MTTVTTKFRIKRTTLWDDEVCPIEGAVREKCDRIERRTCTEAEFDHKFSAREGLWKSKGINHSTYQDGKYIQRIHPDDGTEWFVEISSLEDMKKLEKSAGFELVISFDDQPRIEIYDGYRE